MYNKYLKFFQSLFSRKSTANKIDYLNHPAFLKHLNLVEEATEIIGLQIQDIDLLGRTAPLSDSKKEAKRATTLVVKIRYLKFYQEIATFLVEQLRTSPQQNTKYYLPNVRALLEIYAELLRLESVGVDEQMKLCISKNLYTVASILQCSSAGQHDDGLTNSYKEAYKDWQPFIEELHLSIPKDPLKFTYEKRKELNLKDSIYIILDSKAVSAKSPKTMKVFPGKVGRSYVTYSYLSNYVHGNSLMSGVHGNEDLWIAAEVVMISSLVIELINNTLLGGKRSNKFGAWLNEVANAKPEFVNYWRERRKIKMCKN